MPRRLEKREIGKVTVGVMAATANNNAVNADPMLRAYVKNVK
jgi:hypothetical protein